jgi:uncharacterized LabA/DUF88 family protein
MDYVALLDYDNLSHGQRRRGVRFLAETILQASMEAGAPPPARLRVRLYGGWYDQESLTHRAQELSAQIHETFPCVLAAGSDLRIPTTAELAYAIEASPRQHLLHTYREKGDVGFVHCRSAIDVGCSEPECPIGLVKTLLEAGRCPVASCTVERPQILFRAQQKLVDTMLACDLVFLTRLADHTVVVVTSDDDLWPPISMAVLEGGRVVHVHTKGQSERQFYRVPPGVLYHSAPLFMEG